MKKLSLLLHTPNSNNEHLVLSDKYNLDNSELEVYTFVNKDAFNQLLSNIETDYLMILPEGFQFEYDTALADALNLAKGTDVTSFAIQYEGDQINKFDPKYKQYLINTALSDILLHPSAFVACILSKKAYKLLSVDSDNICSALVRNLLKYLLGGLKCDFVPLHVLNHSCSSTEMNQYINLNYNIDHLVRDFPILEKDYLLLIKRQNLAPTELDIVLDKIQKTFIFKAFISFRNLLKRVGYYDKKASLKYKKYLQTVRRNDAQLKVDIERKINDLPYNMLQRNNDASDIIVSLTTHGKRLAESAPYGIYCLFTQTVLPNRIVLNVNKDVWNEDNLPPLIKRLMKSGLEVVFCKDVRSHTKFLPALERFPNNPIITVDDDMCYEEHMIEELVSAYTNSDKRTIFCRQGVFPKKKNGKYIPYMQWDDSVIFLGKDTSRMSLSVSPYGVHGIIYPPHIFDNEIFNDEVFLKIAPHTDDIWFWAMEVRGGINAQVIRNSRTKEDGSVSLLEYLEEAESTALYFQNCFNGRNDKEMYAILEHYNIN